MESILLIKAYQKLFSKQFLKEIMKEGFYYIYMYLVSTFKCYFISHVILTSPFKIKV